MAGLGTTQEELYAAAAFARRAGTRLRAAPPAPDEPTWAGIANADRPATVQRQAAVLVPIVARGPEASLLLTRRTRALRTHSGQIAFPGGAIDAEDADAWATAIREAGEEIGLRPRSVSAIGYLDAHLSGSGYRVLPVVGLVEAGYSLQLNPVEVDAAFEVPLRFLMDPENHRIDSIEREGRKRYFYAMQYEDHYIWGVTAGIIRALYERVFG